MGNKILSPTKLGKLECGNPLCHNGKIQKIVDGQFVNVECPDCKRIRETLVNDGFIYNNNVTGSMGYEVTPTLLREVLNLPENYPYQEGINEKGMFIHPTLAKKFDKKMYRRTMDALTEMYQNLKDGIVPEQSLLFVLPFSNPLDFIFTCILTAYKNNISTAPYFNELDLRKILSAEQRLDNSDENWKGEYLITYEDLLEADLCIVHKGISESKHDFYNIKQLMEYRAARNKATVIITNYLGTNTRLLWEDLDLSNYPRSMALCVAKLYTINMDKSFTYQDSKEYVDPKTPDDTINPRQVAKMMHSNGKVKNEECIDQDLFERKDK